MSFLSPNSILDDYSAGDILSEIDIAGLISSLGIAVAEGQKALDDNSISQLIRLKDAIPELGGKSLLELGVVAPFYQYKTAQISVSMGYKLKVSEGLSAGLEIGRETTREMTKSSTRGEFSASENSKDIKLSEKKILTNSETGIRAINAYWGMNSEEEDFRIIADKVRVDALSAYSVTTDSHALINKEVGYVSLPKGLGKKWAIWKFDTNIGTSGETAEYASSKNAALTAGANSKDAAKALLTAAKDEEFRAFIVGKDSSGAVADDDLTKVYFNFAKAVICDGTNTKLDGPVGEIDSATDFSDRLTVLRKILIEGNHKVESITGHTDGSGNKQYNQDLSKSRANAVRGKLVESGISALSFVPEATWEGETYATTQSPLLKDRRVDIETDIPNGTYYVYLEETDRATGLFETGGTGVALPQHGSTSGFLIGGTNGSKYEIGNGTSSITADGTNKTEADLKEEFKTKLNTEFQQNFTVAAESSDVHLTKKGNEKFADVTIYGKNENSRFRHGETNLEYLESTQEEESRAKKVEKQVKKTSVSSFNISAEYSKKYDVSISGNLSIDAELAVVPPPEALLQALIDLKE